MTLYSSKIGLVGGMGGKNLIPVQQKNSWETGKWGHFLLSVTSSCHKLSYDVMCMRQDGSLIVEGVYS